MSDNKEISKKMSDNKEISKRKQVALNYITVIIKEIAVILIGLASRAIFLNKLGIKYIGITALFSSVVSMVSLANLGAGKALSYLMISKFAKGDEDGARGLYQYSKQIFLFVAVLVFSLGIAAMPTLNLLIAKEDRVDRLYTCYIIYLTSSVITYVIAPEQAVFIAKHNARVGEVAALLSYSITTVMQIVCLFIVPSYEAYLLMLIVGNVLSIFYVRCKFQKNFQEYNYYKGNIEEEEKHILFERIKDMFLVRIFSTAVDTTDSMLITKYVGISRLGIYNNYSIIFSNVRNVSKNIYGSMESVIGNISAVSNKREAYIFYKRELFGFHCMASVLVTGCYVLTQDFMTLFAGAENLLSEAVIIVILLDLYINIIQYALAGFYNTGNYYSSIKYMAAASAAVNLAVSVVLGIRYGLIGIFIGTIVARAFCTMLGITHIVSRKSFGVGSSGVLSSNGIYLIQVALIAVVGRVLFAPFATANYAVWIIKAVCVVVYACATIALLNCRNDAMQYFVDKILSYFRRHRWRD